MKVSSKQWIGFANEDYIFVPKGGCNSRYIHVSLLGGLWKLFLHYWLISPWGVFMRFYANIHRWKFILRWRLLWPKYQSVSRYTAACIPSLLFNIDYLVLYWYHAYLLFFPLCAGPECMFICSLIPRPFERSGYEASSCSNSFVKRGLNSKFKWGRGLISRVPRPNFSRAPCGLVEK